MASAARTLADIQRTRELTLLAGQFVPKSGFSMKYLQPSSLPCIYYSCFDNPNNQIWGCNMPPKLIFGGIL